MTHQQDNQQDNEQYDKQAQNGIQVVIEPAVFSPEVVERFAAVSPTDPQYTAERVAAWETAVEALTSAARLRHSEGRQLDFADFLTGVLAAVTANIGSVDRLLAGRSGSWEANKIGDLLCSTVGYDGEYLIGHRTEPVVIEIDVDQYLEEISPDFTSPYTLAEDALTEEFGDVVTDEDDDAYEAQIAALMQRWRQIYTGYAETFTAAVRAEVATIPDLRVPVTINARVTFSYPRLSHPVVWGTDTDPLVWRLWAAGTTAINAAIQQATQSTSVPKGEGGAR